MTTTEFDKIAMVQATDLFAGEAGGNRNYMFCQMAAHMTGSASGFHNYFLFNLSPDEVRFTRLLQDAFTAECSPEFLQCLRDARSKEAVFVMFYL